MSTPTPADKRPLSPFMIGPYYKPQLTSMLSITHRATGVFLSVGALFLTWWLMAVAAGPEAYATFDACARGVLGKLVLLGVAFSLIFHWLNGIRHLLWDIGWGLEVPRAYATGWVVVALSAAGTAWLAWLVFGGAA
jgi:succinate dehydrogenase / fumarate reductase cytochrome b subunit